MPEKETLVVDANILISAVLRFNSVTGLAYQKASLHCRLVYSDETIAEVLEVFSRKKFDKYISALERKTFIDFYVKSAIRIEAPELPIPVCRDSKDDKYLALAIAADARIILTGDMDLLILSSSTLLL